MQKQEKGKGRTGGRKIKQKNVADGGDEAEIRSKIQNLMAEAKAS